MDDFSDVGQGVAPSIQGALAELYEWAKSEDFAGHDPHDILTSPFLRDLGRFKTSSSMRLARLVALQLGRRSLLNVRVLLRVPRAENPKALALFLMGLLRAKDAATPEWESDAAQLAGRLLASMRESGGWGYPFPWQSRTHYLREHTPNIVTTAFVGTALLEWNEHAPSPELLEAIRRTASYIVSLETEGPAFGYAENDPQIVFNASLLGAEFLLKAGALLSNRTSIELARRAAEFVANAQRTDGGWDYGLEASQRWTDSFHTGFVITSLKSIADRIHDERLVNSARRGFEYYRRTFLEPDYAIRYFPNKRYPIDAHALGEAMVTFRTFGEKETAERIAKWTIRHLRSPKGYFYYQRHRLFTNRIPYIRWSNAWIFRGLAEVTSDE
ncbi:MAG TPA: prenyltransferase/squalene oxidase repeat-containing protein [Candidatus Kapabacteria bacterium]|nr:prenyltransferase/squalene oxidase repeat-containing protein [Candidatus Kapabacteria bacterium]